MAAQNSEILDELTGTLRANLGCYYPDLAGGTPVLTVETGGNRVLSSLFRFRVESGDEARGIIVKLPGPSEDEHFTDRPKIGLVPDKDYRAAAEYRTLSAIDRHFRSLGDPRFEGIRVLDFFGEHAALALEYKTGVPLNRLLLRTNRVQGLFAGTRVDRALGHAGAWLRSFHEAVASNDPKAINETREKFLNHIASFVAYLEDVGGRGRLMAGLLRRIRDAADRHLDATFPTAINHGDFAPRNVLVGADAQVSVIDTRGLYRTPIFEDLAYFVASLRTSKVQSFTLGAAFGASTLDRQENEFLRGYFGDEAIPRTTIALFTVLVLLDKWCAHADRMRRQQGRGGLAGRLRHACVSAAIDRTLHREIGRQLRLVEASEPPAG
jgi:hypothetical protein